MTESIRRAQVIGDAPASREAADLAAEGRRPDCTYPLDSYGHDVACGGQE